MPPDHTLMHLGQDRLDRLQARGAAFLGTRYAILGGAMSWVSERMLVSAISNAGGFGVIAGGSMGPAALGAEIRATQARTRAPFGVNLITMHPELDALIDTCLAAGVGHVVLAGGVPKRAAVRRVKAGGARVICFAPALVLAQRLVRAGADALVIEGSEAGGHVGPVSLNVLAQEILPHVAEVPVFVAGGIGRGEAIAAYLRMGAAGGAARDAVCGGDGEHRASAVQARVHPRAGAGRVAERAARPELSGDPGAGAGECGDGAVRGAPGGDGAPGRRGDADAGAGAAGDRAFLGGGVAAGGDRGGCGGRFGDGRAVGRDGNGGAADRGDHRRADRAGAGGAGQGMRGRR